MNRRIASMLGTAALACLLLVGCAQVGEQIERLFPGPTPVPNDLAGAPPTATPTVAGPAAPLAPTWTLLPTATSLAGPGAAATSETLPTATSTPIPLVSACAVLWDLYPQGEQLVSEWLDWQAHDPPSLEAHTAKLDEWLGRWSKYQERLERVPPAPEALVLVDTYLASADRWIRGFECASNALSTLNPACSGQGLSLQQEACALWYQAYDQLTQLCVECAGERLPPTATPTPTSAP